MTEALAVREESVSLMSIIDKVAASPDFDIAKLKELLDVKERWERNEARKAFVVAMAAFKADPPMIFKNKHVKFETTKGTTEYDHATLDEVCDAITEGLSAHGLTHRWKVEQEKDWITITCIITHVLGHFEETTMMGAPDNTGSKNSIQAISSTVTYLQRYTLLAATGLAAGDADDDGAGGAPPLPNTIEKKTAAPITPDPVRYQQPTQQAASPQQPKPVQPAARPAPPPPQPQSVRVISEPQSRRFYALWKTAGRTKEEVTNYLQERFGISSDKDIPVTAYNQACVWAGRL